jgi:putative SOS response-associated peptidase YedK
MCSRYLLVSSADLLSRATGTMVFPRLPPRYNAAPTQALPVVRRQTDPENPAGTERRATMMRWGLVPAWSRQPATPTPLTNARIETVAEKPAFREAFRRQRCLVPADGFYEWKPSCEGPRPWLIARCDRAPFCFAGLWDRWTGAGAEPCESFVILTTTPNERVAALHDRMPVVLPPTAYEAWLDPTTAVEELRELLRPSPADEWDVRPVHPRLNRASYDAPDVLDPPPPDAPTQGQLELGW